MDSVILAFDPPLDCYEPLIISEKVFYQNDCCAAEKNKVGMSNTWVGSAQCSAIINQSIRVAYVAELLQG